MAESTTVVTLKAKAADITARIEAYERKLAEAKCDLAHVNATIALFDKPDDPQEHRSYMSVHRLWTRGEAMRACVGALAASPVPLTTIELVEHVMGLKGLDTSDPVMKRGVSGYLVHILRARARRGEVASCGKRNNRVILWRLPGAIPMA